MAVGLEMCVLASGSGGNCTVVRVGGESSGEPGKVILIDAGIAPRVAARRLCGSGAALSAVAGILLTHLDRDHFSPAWVPAAARLGARVFCYRERIDELIEIAGDDGQTDAQSLACFKSLIEPFEESFEPLPGLSARAIALSHDADGSHGFVLAGAGHRLGYATDLGCVPEELPRAFEALDLLALESNYDPRMQRDSGRPIFLQRRIMGGRGHLSNEQAFDAVRAILDRGQRAPAHIVLLHRSRQCNCPKLVRQIFTADPRIAPRLTLAEQFTPTPWLAPGPREPLPGEQLMLGWG